MFGVFSSLGFASIVAGKVAFIGYLPKNRTKRQMTQDYCLTAIFFEALPEESDQETTSKQKNLKVE